MYVPFDTKKIDQEEFVPLEIRPVILESNPAAKSNLPLNFKPNMREIALNVDRKEVNAHFKVILGMYINGKTEPAVSEALV